MEGDGVESAGTAQVEKTPNAWASQDEFLESARKLVERVCTRLGVDDLERLQSNFFGAFDARPGGRAQTQLDLPRVNRRKNIGAEISPHDDQNNDDQQGIDAEYWPAPA